MVRLLNGHYALSWLQVPLLFQVQAAAALNNLPGSWAVVTPESTAFIQGHVVRQVAPSVNDRFFRLAAPPP
jgi:hypothetical protein